MTISTHAKERYAERVMEKDDKTDIKVFIAQHDEDIVNRINKMIEYGELIFSGKSDNEKYKNQLLDVYLDGLWVILVDHKTSNVITLYEIDLNVGDEFNREYVSKLLDMLNLAKRELEQVEDETKIQKNTYQALIDENANTIEEYRRISKSLDEQNQAYRDVINTLDANTLHAEKKVKDIVATMIGRRFF